MVASEAHNVIIGSDRDVAMDYADVIQIRQDTCQGRTRRYEDGSGIHGTMDQAVSWQFNLRQRPKRILKLPHLIQRDRPAI
jgi:hypothetical protein